MLLHSELKGGLRDNAVSAIAKMILQHPKQLPLGMYYDCSLYCFLCFSTAHCCLLHVTEQVLPQFLAALPLEVDMEEANFVYSSLIKMTHTFPKAYPNLVRCTARYRSICRIGLC